MLIKFWFFIEAALQLEQGMALDYLMQIQAAFFMKEVQSISFKHYILSYVLGRPHDILVDALDI